MIGGAVVIAAVFFYGGYAVASGGSKRPAGGMTFRAGSNTAFVGRATTMGGGFTAGSIIAKDAQSITVKLQDGGSKIVFISGSAQVTKTATGTIDDLGVGSGVLVTGTSNPDGSLTAQSVQIRPTR